jgi:putative SOS response-associated peptidase YedK
MCVRYTLHKTDAALAAISRALGVPLETPDWAAQPRYNVAPTNVMPVVARTGGATAVRPMQWGFLAAATDGGSRPRLLANARAETVAKMPAFRQAIARRRCLVPANGFYEWKERGGIKWPHLFTLGGEEPFAFGAIWDEAAGTQPETYCLLTTEPNLLVAGVHNRMPVILTGNTASRWLGEAPLSPEEFGQLVRPIDAGLMEEREVSRFVSNSRHEGPQCLAPPEAVQAEPELDFGQAP